MDKFGVPKKINRHVIKAMYDLDQQEHEYMNFSNICNAVEFTMKNNVPVANLQSAVRQSLLNLCKLGFIEKQGTRYYRTSKNVEARLSVPSKRANFGIFKRTAQDEKESNLNPNTRKRRLLSEDSLSENNTENSIRRFRITDKFLSRKGRQVDLPKVRLHEQTSKMQKDLCSSNESDSGEENENKAICSSFDLKHKFSSEVFEVKVTEQIELPKLYENNGNLLQSLGHEVIDSEIPNNKQSKCDDVLVLFENDKSNALNEKETQLDEQNELKTSSEHSPDINEENKNSVASSGTEPDSINGKGSHENIEDDSTEKPTNLNEPSLVKNTLSSNIH